MEHESPFGLHPARGDLGEEDRPTGEDGDPRAVAVEGNRLVGGCRNEHVGGHAPILS